MEDGATLRDHLMSMWRQAQFKEEEKPEKLNPVGVDQSILYLWEYFLDMSKRRTSNGFGYNPIPEEGVTAWEKRRGIKLAYFENELIDQVEMLFLRIRNSKDKS
jgi:hypothetical protein